jgi:hypothetical protein
MSTKDELEGMAQIAFFTNLGVETILYLIREFTLPVAKRPDGSYYSSRSTLDAWAQQKGLVDKWATQGRMQWPQVDSSSMMTRLRPTQPSRRRPGPGPQITGSLGELSAKLCISTRAFLNVSCRTGGPVQLIAGTNLFTVDLNEWDALCAEIGGVPT